VAKDAAKAAVSSSDGGHAVADRTRRGSPEAGDASLYKLAEGHIAATLGSIPVEQLSTADVTRLQTKLKATPYLANRVIAALSSLLTWCERQGSEPLAESVSGHREIR
jgi:hypothetical protein